MTDPDPEKVADAVAELYREIRGLRPRDKQADTTSQMSKGRPSPRVSPVIRYVRSLGEDYLTSGEVAEQLGVSPSYIRKLEDVTNTPSYSAPFGKFRIRIYTPEDVQALREEIHKRMGGLQPTKESHEEADRPGTDGAGPGSL